MDKKTLELLINLIGKLEPNYIEKFKSWDFDNVFTQYLNSNIKIYVYLKKQNLVKEVLTNNKYINLQLLKQIEKHPITTSSNGPLHLFEILSIYKNHIQPIFFTYFCNIYNDFFISLKQNLIEDLKQDFLLNPNELKIKYFNLFVDFSTTETGFRRSVFEPGFFDEGTPLEEIVQRIYYRDKKYPPKYDKIFKTYRNFSPEEEGYDDFFVLVLYTWYYKILTLNFPGLLHMPQPMYWLEHFMDLSQDDYQKWLIYLTTEFPTLLKPLNEGYTRLRLIVNPEGYVM